MLLRFVTNTLLKRATVECIALRQQQRLTLFSTSVTQRQSKQSTTKKPNEDEQISNEPMQFFGSSAATWRAKDTRSGGADEVLWYQPYVISLSLAVFLIYFCVLREESDIDRKLEGHLYDQVSGLEEISLTVNYKYNKEHNLDNTAVIKRLTELGIDIKQLDAQ